MTTVKQPGQDLAAVLDTIKPILQNPMVLGLLALIGNQAAYRYGIWDARKSPDGYTYSWTTKWGFSDGGLHLGDRTWERTDPEKIAASNATIIGDMIIASTIAYAAKAPNVMPLIGVK